MTDGSLGFTHGLNEKNMRLKRFLLPTSLALFALNGTAIAAQPKDGSIGFQEAATPVMEQLVHFHNVWLMTIITVITLFVMVLMAYILFKFNHKRNPIPSKTSHNTAIEIVWTVVPVLILLVMVVPSMKLLYFQDVIPESEMTIKVTGNTWNWEYAYPDYEDQVESFVSNVLEEADAKAAGKPYLLGTDAPLVVPVNTTVKVLVTSANNLHSFAMPAFGIKMDAVPGRINETWFKVTREGTYFGQCSELCGVRHAYMPIEIEVVSKAKFDQWVNNGGVFSTQISEVKGGGMTAAQK